MKPGDRDAQLSDRSRDAAPVWRLGRQGDGCVDCVDCVCVGVCGAAGILSSAPSCGGQTKLTLASFATLHKTKHFPTVSLLVLGAVSVFFCLFRLPDLIAALIIQSIVFQFLLQAVGWWHSASIWEGNLIRLRCHCIPSRHCWQLLDFCLC